MPTSPRRGLHWLRQDLRLHDQPALAWLMQRVDQWLPVFVIDPRFVDRETEDEPRTRYLFATLDALASELDKRGVPLIVRRGLPERVIPALLRETGAGWLGWQSSHGALAGDRDEAVAKAANELGVEVAAFEGHGVFAPGEITTAAGHVHQVFTPFRNAWWRAYREAPRAAARAPRLAPPIPGVHSDEGLRIGEAAHDARLPRAGEAAARRRLARFLDRAVTDYHEARDFPALDATAKISPDLRTGALSVRVCFDKALALAEARPEAREGVQCWLDELVWREFYAATRAVRPEISHTALKPELDDIEWNRDPVAMAAWRAGRTGFPIVDAGMRQLAATGWMHNRVRMVVASFLTKDLGIDWRAGAAHFRRSLLDYDAASNAGGWQWAASTGTDAQPWFRIFNPWKQGERWDPTGAYIRRWVPELRQVEDAHIHHPHLRPGGAAPYPLPIVDHAEQREITLERYRAAREGHAAEPLELAG